MPIERLGPTTLKSSPLELATHQIMRPGGPVPGMRRASVAIASTNPAAQTQLLVAPVSKRWLVKSVIITNPTAGIITVTMAGQANGNYSFLFQVPIASQTSLSIPMALVLNDNAGVGLFAAASAAGLIATVNYGPLHDSELPQQLTIAYGVQGGAARADMVAVTPAFVITWIMICSTAGVAANPIYYGVQGTHVADLVVPANGLAVIDDPLYLNPGDTFSAQNFSAAGNWVSVTAGGYPALS